MYSLRIAEVSKQYQQAENETVMAVRVEILQDDEILEERSLAFPLGTTQTELKKELKKYLKTYELDMKLAEESKETEKKEEEFAKVSDKFTGLTL